jgi:ADP-heptose:LPS heptosyltransferase
MQACTCMLTMDSANMHLASLQGVQVVSIWGATHSEIGFAPLYGNEKNIVEISRKDLPCRPCSVFGNKPCKLTQEPYACFNRITTVQIMDKLNAIP